MPATPAFLSKLLTSAISTPCQPPQTRPHALTTCPRTLSPASPQVVQLAEYRAQLYEYLKSRMAAIAPNLTVLVGELVGARLIAHAGSLMSLAKYPASTVQILGAEKARGL